MGIVEMKDILWTYHGRSVCAVAHTQYSKVILNDWYQSNNNHEDSKYQFYVHFMVLCISNWLSSKMNYPPSLIDGM